MLHTINYQSPQLGWAVVSSVDHWKERMQNIVQLKLYYVQLSVRTSLGLHLVSRGKTTIFSLLLGR